MIGVMTLHYVGSYGGGIGYAKDDSFIRNIMFFLQSLSSCSVNVFLLISGYFLSKTNMRSYKKIFELFLQVIIFNAAFYLGSTLLGINAFDINEFLIFCIPNNYFVVLYMALYIISPYINLMLDQLSQNQFKQFLASVLFVFLGWNFVTNILESILKIERKAP